ncbi:preprotein translocase subunit YajC [Polaribacter sp. WD7]|uniref:preprotein translocase subunit YajC n=1 Tax=Polaribacter sp. WD7 TaxID=2269061 RepID=UPI000DF1FD1B|nr:preprotein translocase subunit YajC [Polaribacter sp. WD7]RCS27214.1 preprotein translocase subunit YajC [Polaribacter sp. WD7]
MNFTIIALQEAAGSLMSMLPFLAIIAVFYFFMIRPQMSRQKKEKAFQAEIKKGTKVVTSSGIHGKIAEINSSDNTVTVETGAGKIRFERSAISMELSKKQSNPVKK